MIPERIQPGHPEQNGRLERFHRTLNEEALHPVGPTPARQQRVFDSYLYRYNHQRPHEALGQTPPAAHYRPSPRPYPRTVASPVYDAGVIVRRVRRNGEIKWGGGLLYLSEALIGEPVGLVQRDDRYWTVRFGPWRSACWTPTEGVSCTPPSPCYPCDRFSVTYVPGRTNGYGTPARRSPTADGAAADVMGLLSALGEPLWSNVPGYCGSRPVKYPCSQSSPLWDFEDPVSVRSDQNSGRGVQLDAGALQGCGLAHPQVIGAPLSPVPQIGLSTGLLQHTSGVGAPPSQIDQAAPAGSIMDVSMRC